MSEFLTAFQFFRSDGGTSGATLKAEADLNPPQPRIADLNVKLRGGTHRFTYLDISRTTTEPDVLNPGGKILGPIVTMNLRLPGVEPLAEELLDSGKLVGLYPCSEAYGVYGVWGLLDLVSGGLA